MLSNFVVGFITAIGVGGFVYSKTMHHNGGQSQQALIVAGVAGFIACIVIATLLGVFFHS